MEKNQTFHKDIQSIRQLMERSVKFLSLSGLSGILAGIYALAGAAYAYYKLPSPESPLQYSYGTVQENMPALLTIAVIILVTSIITGYFMADQKAKRLGVKVWDHTSRRLLINLSVPLIAGGLFILALFLSDHAGLIAPASLLFYGMALLNASHQLYDEVRYLGYTEISLGLMATFLPGYGLAFWAIGFGALHIIYGAWMFKKYDR
jgi:predicted lysophospholipase L1 biosynthesis ABC-type transport system permease subunit